MANDDYAYDEYGDDVVEEMMESMDDIPIVILLFIATLAFYFQAVVTEEVNHSTLFLFKSFKLSKSVLLFSILYSL